MTLPTDSKTRKRYPIARGLFDYFPDALAAVANVSYIGNEQHNPGEPMHWAREKSTDHADCIARHLIERGRVDVDGVRHSAKLAWRALANLQIELEDRVNDDLTESAGFIPSVCDQCGPRHRCGVDCSHEDGDAISCDNPTAFVVDGQQNVEPTQTTAPGCSYIQELCDRMTWRAARLDFPVFYVAGPMTGCEYYNFPAFDDAKKRGERLGYGIISPADIDREAWGIDPAESYSAWLTLERRAKKWTEDDWRQILLRDIAAILSLSPKNGDGVALLPGWERSTGALAELCVARWMGLRIVDARTFKPFEPFNPAERMAIDRIPARIIRYIESAEDSSCE